MTLHCGFPSFNTPNSCEFGDRAYVDVIFQVFGSETYKVRYFQETGTRYDGGLDLVSASYRADTGRL